MVKKKRQRRPERGGEWGFSAMGAETDVRGLATCIRTSEGGMENPNVVMALCKFTCVF